MSNKKKIPVFFEGTKYREETITERCLGIDATDAEGSTFLDTLGELIISQQKYGAKSVSKQVVLVRGGKDSECSFNFVGLMVLADTSFLVMPKYFRHKGNSEFYCSPESLQNGQQSSRKQDIDGAEGIFSFADASLVLDAIRTYLANDVEQADSYLPSDSHVKNRELSTWLWILEDFNQNGLYELKRRMQRKNGNGIIDWDRTIQLVDPLFTKRSGYPSPIYDQWWDVKRRVDEEALVRRIHAAVVAKIWSELNEIGICELLRFPEPDVIAEDLSVVGDKDYLVAIVRSQMSQEFMARNQRLLKAIEHYLIGEQSLTDGKPYYVGTTAFEFIWESALQRILGHQDFSIDKPQWQMSDGKDSVAGEDEDALSEDGVQGAPLRPDVIIRTDTELHIFDAKYYVPSWPLGDRKRITGQPGVNDIVKQYMYQVALEKYRKKRVFGFNAFLMPATIELSSGENPVSVEHKACTFLPFIPKYLRLVESPEQSDVAVKLKNIDIFLLDPTLVFEQYVGRQPHVGVLLDLIRDCLETDTTNAGTIKSKED